MISETYTQSRPKLILASLSPLAVAAVLGVCALASNNLVAKWTLGLLFSAILIFVISMLAMVLHNPASVEFDDDKLSVSIPITGKSERFYWRDIAEVAAEEGRSSARIRLKFKQKETYKRTKYYVPAFWSGINRDEMVTKMDALRKNAAAD